MKLIVAIALVMSFSTTTFATGQQADKLFWKGKEYDLYSNPLEAFYPDETKRPHFMVGPMRIVTSNWRGYVASWTIENNALYLTGIESWFCTGSTKKSCRKVTLNHIFGKRVKQGRVLADWFSWDLRVPDGKELQYVHMGYGSIYERDFIFEVAAGRVTKQTVIDNTQRALPSELELQRQELEKMKPKGKETPRP